MSENTQVEGFLEAFWVRAVTRGRINPLEVITGGESISAFRPPACSFGLTAAEATEIAELIVAGKKTATSSWADSYRAEEVPLPEKGDLAIVLDGAERPRALIRTDSVEVMPFAEVGADIALAEGEGDGSLESWRAAHAEFFRTEAAAIGLEFNPAGDVVVERFTVLYSDRDDHLGPGAVAGK
ncbi:ASCH domain-containing protein [Actinotignum sanguinis]|uniref:ASCH domain-containing protein n=2 Tax=Actinomycetaceae TaxID=2049 RepID=A0ABZ0RAM4_9ACTO|nr:MULTISPECIES: ASCH domain-containing protein [Actinotignum]WPJ88489.1 ASCH domain-containing protein [Schaalia turicensis]MDE1552205.1 ASCH domain-containing protein [Actinotignum sanguinis]MDE1565478.1 ASCH domain-containing protein [Actinotignum sanguinis]MDE1577552.1 ASCH domain-containing protein [Actinotignum sanguinis]MDE1642547.1 ASCH domain-containing protein [Actinotignum sanguinis]